MKEKWLEYLRAHTGLVIGLAGGLVCAILLMTLGFWRTLLLAALCALGAYIGSQVDQGVNLAEKLYRTWMRIKTLFGPK